MSERFFSHHDPDAIARWHEEYAKTLDADADHHAEMHDVGRDYNALRWKAEWHRGAAQTLRNEVSFYRHESAQQAEYVTSQAAAADARAQHTGKNEPPREGE